MVIAIFGESCTGKSTLADPLAAQLGANVYTGKDYLRLAKSEAEAERLFCELLRGEEPVVYVLAEPELLRLLPDGGVRVLAKASLETIRQRFAARMRGNLPAPVAQVLERKHGAFDDVPCDLVYDSDSDAPEQTRACILALLGQ